MSSQHRASEHPSREVMYFFAHNTVLIGQTVVDFRPRLPELQLNRTSAIRATLFACLISIAALFVHPSTAMAEETTTVGEHDWTGVVDCESDFRWHVADPAGLHFGGLQFLTSTWLMYGGGEFAPRADKATPVQQVIVAERVVSGWNGVKGQGLKAWQCRGGIQPGVTTVPVEAPSDVALAASVAPEPTPAPEPVVEATVPEPTPAPAPVVADVESTDYSILSGDTLNRIASAAYQDTNKVADIVNLNPDKITDPDVIYAGDVIKLPGTSVQVAPPAPAPEPTPAETPAAAPALEVAASTAPVVNNGWVNPLHDSSYRCTSGFGPRWGTQHGGVDMALPIGNPVYAATSGYVKRAGATNGFGLAVVILGDDGMYTEYGHVDSVNVGLDTYVNAGDLIAYTGNRGQSTGPHLHFGVGTSFFGGHIDPEAYMADHGITLC